MWGDFISGNISIIGSTPESMNVVCNPGFEEVVVEEDMSSPPPPSFCPDHLEHLEAMPFDNDPEYDSESVVPGGDYGPIGGPVPSGLCYGKSPKSCHGSYTDQSTSFSRGHKRDGLHLRLRNADIPPPGVGRCLSSSDAFTDLLPELLSPVSPKRSRKGEKKNKQNGSNLGERGRNALATDRTATFSSITSSVTADAPKHYNKSRNRGVKEQQKLQDLLINSPTCLSLETVQLGDGLRIHMAALEVETDPVAEDAGVEPRKSAGNSDRNKRKYVLEEEEEKYHAGFISYERDIYLHRRSLEMAFHPLQCLQIQPEVTLDMRTVLVDWLTKLCRHFHFGQETLFLAVNIMDRFLNTTPVSRDCFQLLGITTFLIAAKQEEISPPEIVELVRLCCHAYNREQVKQLELIILNRLQFDLLVPTVQFFLEYYCSTRMQLAVHYDYAPEKLIRTRALGRYLLEQCLQDYDVCQFQPSLLALSILEVADDLLNHHSRPTTRYCGGHSPTTIQQCYRRVKSVARRQMGGQDVEKICQQYRHAPYANT